MEFGEQETTKPEQPLEEKWPWRAELAQQLFRHRQGIIVSLLCLSHLEGTIPGVPGEMRLSLTSWARLGGGRGVLRGVPSSTGTSAVMGCLRKLQDTNLPAQLEKWKSFPTASSKRGRFGSALKVS